MSRKSFHICVDFEVHAVTCPGVWLCPKGHVMLRITMFNLSVNTKSLMPTFPLLFHEKFRFHKMLRRVSSLSMLQELLKERTLQLQLIHVAASPGCSPTTVLATFKSPLSDVFYPSPNDRGLNAGVDVDLLLRPSAYFPGIISPKVEISTRVIIEEVINYYRRENETWIHAMNPLTIPSKRTGDDVINMNEDGGIIRQRPVCHNPEVQCTCCGCYKRNTSNIRKPPFIAGKSKRVGKASYAFMKPNSRPGRFQKKRFSKTKPVVNSDSSIECVCNSSSSPTADSSSSVCKCILCKKYKDYFTTDVNDKYHASFSGTVSPKSLKAKPKVMKSAGSCQRKQKSDVSSKKRPQTGCAAQTDRHCKTVRNPKPVDPELKVTVKKLSAATGNDVCTCKGCSNCCGNINKPSSSTVKETPTNDLQKKAGSSGQYCHTSRQATSESRPASSLLNQLPTTSRHPPATDENKPKDTCRCGIYSCPDWQAQKARDQQASELTKLSTTPSWIRQNRTHRQLFYANLEDYYKKLYNRARERSSLEGVQACA